MHRFAQIHYLVQSACCSSPLCPLTDHLRLFAWPPPPVNCFLHSVTSSSLELLWKTLPGDNSLFAIFDDHEFAFRGPARRNTGRISANSSLLAQHSNSQTVEAQPVIADHKLSSSQPHTDRVALPYKHIKWVLPLSSRCHRVVVVARSGCLNVQTLTLQSLCQSQELIRMR